MLEPRGNDLLAYFLFFVVVPLVTYLLLGILNDLTKKKEQIHSVVNRAVEDPQGEIMAVGTCIPLVQLPTNGAHQCAKCLGSARTRCSGCKSVWYCSGRCQVLHWRQAHRLECQQLRKGCQRSSFQPILAEGWSEDAHLNLPAFDQPENLSSGVVSSESSRVEREKENPLDKDNYNDGANILVDDALFHDSRMDSMNEEFSCEDRTISIKGMKTMSHGPESATAKRNDKQRAVSRPNGINLMKSSKSKDKVAKELLSLNTSSESPAANKPKSGAARNDITLQGSSAITDMGILRLMSMKKSRKTVLKCPEDKVHSWRNSKSRQMIYPYEEFVKCFQYEVLNIIPRGLVNCGNSCYANAVLQCLTCTKPLIIYLLRHSHSKLGCAKDRCIMCELEKLVVVRKDTGGPLSPMNILVSIRRLNSQIGHGSQEDAHEFLRLLVASMQSVCLEGIGGENVVDQRLQDTTFVQHLFGGCLRSKVRCLRCNHESERYENMMDLTLEISGWVESLQDALTQFTSPEDLDGENMYRCVRCNEYVRARKQLNIQESPNILTIVLKRFQEGGYGKINKCITFPEMLDMVPFMTGSDDIPPFYMLYGVVVHMDTSNASVSGHYISYVKDLNGNWFCVDDSEVRPVELSQVMSVGAYILFYMRSSPRPPIVTRTGVSSAVAKHSTSAAEPSRPYSSIDRREQLDNRLEMNPELSRISGGITIRETRFRPSTHRSHAEFSDAASSEFSLFTSSDDSSFTTESTRDSFSTIDQADIPFSSIFQSLYPDVYTSKSNAWCSKSS